MGEAFEPIGTPFFDNRSRREMVYVMEGPWAGWLCFRHPDGQWVTLRRATDDDLSRIADAIDPHDERDFRPLSREGAIQDDEQ